MSGKENGNAAVHSSPGGGGGGTGGGGVTGALPPTSEAHQYVGPYRLEKTLGKGQTGKEINKNKEFIYSQTPEICNQCLVRSVYGNVAMS